MELNFAFNLQSVYYVFVLPEDGQAAEECCNEY
jgi:hypothetical protein